MRQPVTHAKRAGAGPAYVRTRRPGPAPRPGFVTGCAALAGLGFGVTVGTVIIGETRGSLAAPGGLLIAGGRLAGFTGAYLMLIMVVLIARLPWLEAAVGQDRLIRWHRRVGPWAFGLITAHVVLITLGYAQAAQVGALRQLWVFLTSYPDLLAATVGFGLLVMAGVTSIRIARRRLKYETWWVVHLYMYLALALAFAHQIVTGVSFIGHPLTRAVWIAVWACTAGMVIVFRVAQPIWRSLRHRLRVVAVREEAPGVVSVICPGRRLDRLAVSGGQFFQWRFLTRDLWWHAHPYSLSALPRPPYIRVTVKGLGDQSRAVRRLRPGTRVAIEGPYGAFTHHARISDRVVLIGAGVGITPLRALLEDLPAWIDVVVIVRASTPGISSTGTRSLPSSGGAAAGSTRSSARATGSASTPVCCDDWFPTWPSATSMSADPTGSARMSSAPRRGSASPRSRSTGKRSDSRPKRTDITCALPEDQLDETGTDRDSGDRGGPGRRAGLPHHAGAPQRRHIARGFRDLGARQAPADRRGARGPAARVPRRRQPVGHARPQRRRTHSRRNPDRHRPRGQLQLRRLVGLGDGVRQEDNQGRDRLPRRRREVPLPVIDQQSIPILEQEALQAQSANIQGVSGASYTSAGFQQSLQARTAKLGFSDGRPSARGRAACPRDASPRDTSWAPS